MDTSAGLKVVKKKKKTQPCRESTPSRPIRISTPTFMIALLFTSRLYIFKRQTFASMENLPLLLGVFLKGKTCGTISLPMLQHATFHGWPKNYTAHFRYHCALIYCNTVAEVALRLMAIVSLSRCRVPTGAIDQISILSAQLLSSL